MSIIEKSKEYGLLSELVYLRLERDDFKDFFNQIEENRIHWEKEA